MLNARLNSTFGLKWLQCYKTICLMKTDALFIYISSSVEEACYTSTLGIPNSTWNGKCPTRTKIPVGNGGIQFSGTMTSLSKEHCELGHVLVSLVGGIELQILEESNLQ